LTFADSRRVGRATVFRDVSWADGSRALTSLFHVLPDDLTLATAGGSTGYTYYRYRGAPGSAEGGGLLVLTVHLAMPTDIGDAVRTAYALPPDAEVTVTPPPISAGAARMSLAGESAAGEFVTSVSCTSDAGSGGVSVVAALTTDGVALIDQALEQGIAPVHVELDLSVGYVLDDLELTVWCDAEATGQVAQDLAAAGQAGPGALAAELTARHLAGTTLVTTRSLSAVEETAVQALSTQVLQGVLLPRLLDEDGAPRTQPSTLDQHTTFTLTASAPGLLPVSRSANLVLPEGAAHTVSTDLDAAGLRRLVRVSAMGDLAARGIDTVVVALDYTGHLPDGTVLRRTADLALRPGRPAAAAAFDIASSDQREVAAQVSVHFADGSPPYVFDLSPADAEAIDLDVDSLGVLVVDVDFVSADPGAPVQAVVDLAYAPADTAPAGTAPADPAQAGRVVLDGAQPTARWLAVVRETPAGYRYRVTWVRGPEREEGDWQPTDRALLRIDVPAAPPTDTVTVISAGSFDQLSALVVELRGATDAPTTTLTFTSADQTRTWTLPPGCTEYEYRTTLVRPDGTHTDGVRISTDQPVLVVRDALRYDVTVIPTLLGIGSGLTRALVELESPEHTAPHVTLVFDDPPATARAALRLADAGDHTYRYRLTRCPPAQPPEVGDWRSGSSSVLVLS